MPRGPDGHEQLRLAQCLPNTLHMIGHLAKPNDIYPGPCENDDLSQIPLQFLRRLSF